MLSTEFHLQIEQKSKQEIEQENEKKVIKENYKEITNIYELNKENIHNSL